MTAASIIGIHRYVFYRLELAAYFENPGDGRIHPSIPARDILQGSIAAFLLRTASALGIEVLSKSTHAKKHGMARRFGDDTNHGCPERLDPSVLRAAIYSMLRRVKRGKAIEHDNRVHFAVRSGHETASFACMMHGFPKLLGVPVRAGLTLRIPFSKLSVVIAGYDQALCSISTNLNVQHTYRLRTVLNIVRHRGAIRFRREGWSPNPRPDTIAESDARPIPGGHAQRGGITFMNRLSRRRCKVR